MHSQPHATAITKTMQSSKWKCQIWSCSAICLATCRVTRMGLKNTRHPSPYFIPHLLLHALFPSRPSFYSLFSLPIPPLAAAPYCPVAFLILGIWGYTVEKFLNIDMCVHEFVCILAQNGHHSDELGFVQVNSFLGQIDNGSIVIINSKLQVYNEINFMFIVTDTCSLSSMIPSTT